MNASLKQVFADKIITASFGIFIFFLLLCVIFTVSSFKHLPPFIPLYNQLPWGEGRLGGQIQIFIPLLVLIFTGVGNFIVTVFVHNRMPLVARLLSTTTFLIALLALLLIIRTILIIL